MNKNVEIISLIYKSVDYLHLIYEQMKSDNCKVDGWDVGVRLILNDATDEIKEEIKKLDIKYTIFDNVNPNEYYINRVYRAYNYGVLTSFYDNVVLVNSDNVFSKDWLKNLLKHHDGVNIPVGVLVESGKMGSGKYGISKNFGRTATTIDYKAFEEFVEQTKVDRIAEGGLFGPCLFERKKFIEGGMYPEGNFYHDGIGTKNGIVIQTSDDYFFKKLENDFNMKHITVFDSIVYHVQEGEKDS